MDDLGCQAVSLDHSDTIQTNTDLIFPGILERDALVAGNPLATYAEMVKLERDYLASDRFAAVYPQVRLNFEQFLGFPCAGVQAMSLLGIRMKTDSSDVRILDDFDPIDALEVVRREAASTRMVIYGEEHHLPQTRALFAPMLEALRDEGYRYLAAEAFEDSDMGDFHGPDYETGYYLRDPVYASAIRVAQDLGYTLVSYDTRERGPEGDASFRDVTQAQNIKARVFDRDPQAKVIILAGRGHASEYSASDGWTPMASVLKELAGIDPFTMYAPAMTERLHPEEEDPLYRYATAEGLVEKPVIFVDDDGSTFGSTAFDAYVFWPRTSLIHGRPDWMVTVLGRTPVKIPEELLRGEGMMLVQAFHADDSASSIPADQVVLSGDAAPALMLSEGSYWLRAIDPENHEIGRVELRVN